MQEVYISPSEVAHGQMRQLTCRNPQLDAVIPKMAEITIRSAFDSVGLALAEGNSAVAVAEPLASTNNHRLRLQLRLRQKAWSKDRFHN